MARALPSGRKEEAGTVSAHGVVAPPPLRIETDAFSGDLAGLFRLARDGRVDLFGVPLAAICESYREYRTSVTALGDDDLEVGGTALAILAYLAERKAWLLVPRAEEPPLVPELADLDFAGLPPVIATAILFLHEGRELRERIFFRSATPDAEDYELPLDLGSVTANDLALAMSRLLRSLPPPAPESLAPSRPNLAEVMRGLLGRLSADPQSLARLFEEAATRADLVFGFLALLELIRLGQAVAIWREGEVAVRRP